MSCILNIETSTTVCSVAASQDGQTIFVKEDLKGPSSLLSQKSSVRLDLPLPSKQW